ncbi:hypothetical protein BDV37DRAFT_287547 [Aspergillus pseudonomiae]|uniref:Beta/gamma crystallin 'Greek key' domain-containing protein n=1 Tax=Aspergillus pseudonomiae TaxID=1506151 RepID=A0A5N7CZD6_9EURO|nr:uncharacterized protein BDV37DRAFT_287547 [Aspergillus pseudonomiae]KAE8399525.1 hypothetical protein BDV37DRAFT_287547 [Aspergillus pseudonomiae]
MRFTSAFLVLAAAIGAAAEGAIGITVCDGANYAGDCIDIQVYLQHQCYNLNGTPVSGNVRSVKIPNGYRCRFWTSTVCNGGGTGDIQYPGQGSTSPPSVNSVKCYAD